MSALRILVLRGGAIGDFILTLPVFDALKIEWPDCEIEVIGYPRIAELAVHAGLVSRVRSLDEAWVAQLFIPDVELPPAEKKYIQGFDFVFSYLYDPDERVKNSLVHNGAKHVLCCSHRREDVTPHAIDFFMGPLAEMAIYPNQDRPKIGAYQAPGKNRLALQPGSGSPFKNWPLDRYIDVAQRWLAERGAVSFILGEVESDFGAEIRKRVPGAAIIEGVTLIEVAEALKEHDQFIGNDTGISHLAAACGLPVTVLFGGSDPAVWAPRGEQVTVVQGRSLFGLCADEVWETVSYVG